MPLDLPRYLLGVAEIAWLAGFAAVGGAALRARLLPWFEGAPALLATVVISLAISILTAEACGTFGLFEPVPYLVAVAVVGGTIWLRLGGGRGCPACLLDFSRWRRRPSERAGERKINAAALAGHPRPPSWGQGSETTGRRSVATLVALAVTAAAAVKFGLDVKPKLTTGMTGFDSTWYHGPFAAGFFQSGNTWDLHFIAPQFLAWFYPANAELFHAGGMLAFDRDLLSPLLNLGWFVGCLVACWCIGRPYGVAPWSLALGAVALSLPVLSDQAGEARNDIVGIFFLLAAVAIALTAWSSRRPGTTASAADEGFRTHDSKLLARRPAAGSEAGGDPGPAWVGPIAVVGLAAGLAAGTKLNFLLPAAVLVVGLALVAPRGTRWRAFVVSFFAALVGGGYWYLRNLVQSGNPLPWFTDLGPITLPGPDQPLGGREGHTVLGYVFDGSVWSDWFLPGLSDGLTMLWPLLTALALAGLILTAHPLFRRSLARRGGDKEQRGRVGRVDGALGVVGLAGLAALLAWLIAPTSASGPDGMPRGFESGLRYLAPALVLGLALLPTVPQLRGRLGRLAERTAAGKGEGGEAVQAGSSGVDAGRDVLGGDAPVPSGAERGVPDDDAPRGGVSEGVASGRVRRLRGLGLAMAVGVVLVAIAIGYPVQRHYLENRYADPNFAAPGLNEAFAWPQGVTNSRIATTTTRQYPLFGPDLSNEVQFVGEPRPDGGFVEPTTCQAWRRLLDGGDYDYVIASRDRLEPGKPPYPASAAWTESAASQTIVSTPPTKVFKLTLPQDPSAC